jgi:hypothetical protein
VGDRHGLILDYGVRMGLLSNSVGEDAVYDRALMGELFDGDDLPGNLKPARELGLAIVLHRGDARATLAEIDALLK